MRVFVTGASGWIGSAVVPELLAAGHEVTGLARSEESAARLRAAGATPLPGSLDDLESIRAGAAASDGVVHLAFKHDFSDYAGAGRSERAAIETIGDALTGSGRPLLFASGLAILNPGRPLTEDEAVTEANRIWDEINGPNLKQNVQPTRSRATLVLRKAGDHSVRFVRLRKL